MDKIFAEFVKYWPNLKILAKFDPQMSCILAEFCYFAKKIICQYKIIKSQEEP